PAATPPMVFDDIPATHTPSSAFGTPAAPLAFVPMKLPVIVVENELPLPPFSATPMPALPEMTLRSAAVVPPMVVNEAPSDTVTPLRPLPVPFATACVPVASVPMKLPLTALFVRPDPLIKMPSETLPEITLP